MSKLTEDQMKRMEENRRRALAIKSAKSVADVDTVIKQLPLNGKPCSTSSKNSISQQIGYKMTSKEIGVSVFKCSFLQSDRFLVTCPYNAKFVTVFKSIASRRFDPASKEWSFNLSDYDTLSKKLKEIGQELPCLGNAALFQNTHGNTAALPLNNVCKGSCRLITPQRFEVDMPYDARCVALFKTMDSRSYDVDSRKWSFDLSEYNKLVKELRKDPSICVEPLPSYIMTVFKESIAGRTKDHVIPEYDLLDVDEQLVSSLMPFQREGVRFAISRKGRILLADDMGLGKTVQSICIAAYYRQQWPLLIVCPSSVRLMWKESLLRWLPNQLTEDDISVILTGRDFSSSCCPVTIISYDLLTKKHKELEARNYQVAIVDESHFIKNFKTARARASVAVLRRASRLLLLSGTPALSRPVELYTQLSLIRPDLFSRFHQFGLRYCDAKQNPWGWEYSGSSNMGELRLLLQESVMLRRTKDDVLSQLPPKLRRSVSLDVSCVKVTAGQQHAIDEIKVAVGQRGLSALEKHGILLQYFNETAHLKLAAVKSYVCDLLESDSKFLLFAHHRTMLNGLQGMLDEKNIEYIRIDGNTPSERRQTVIARFQECSKCKVALLSITAANMGITLSAASLVVFAELFWNPGILVQAEDRCYRIGQRDVVNVHYLVAKGTADDYIWQMVKEKLEILGKAGLNGTNFNDTESHVVKKREENNLLHYFQKTGRGCSDCHAAETLQPTGSVNRCSEQSADDDDDDDLLLEALEMAESQSDGASDSKSRVSSDDSQTSAANGDDVAAGPSAANPRKRFEGQNKFRQQTGKRCKI